MTNGLQWIHVFLLTRYVSSRDNLRPPSSNSFDEYMKNIRKELLTPAPKYMYGPCVMHYFILSFHIRQPINIYTP